MQFEKSGDIRSYQCINHIQKLCKAMLEPQYFNAFIHDVSYGRGQFSILSNSAKLLQSYYQNPRPAFYTNENGRALPDGIYVMNDLPKSTREKANFDEISQDFDCNHIISIVKHEGDIQNTYSFFLKYNEKQLMFFMLNNINKIKHFINTYLRTSQDALDYVKQEKDHLILPYSLDQNNELSDFLQFNAIDETHDNKLLRIPHALTHEIMYLSKQQASCLSYLLKGLSAKEIANQMGLSYRTVQNYTHVIYDTLGLNNSRELISHYAYLI